jgi:signal transduction histidine kinase/CheY-like chemotaxis protein
MELKDNQLSNSRLSALVSNLNAGVLVEDEHRIIALINHQFCTLFGIPVDPAFLIGTDCSQSAEQSKDMFTDPVSFIERIDEILSKHEICLNDELDLVDGRVFERDYVPIIAEGIFLGNLWQYRDITQRKQNERLLELARLAAENANRAKSAFLANMSHEIRTPLNAVHGIVRLLAEAPRLPEQEDLHDRLISSSESLLTIINDILDFSKIEAGLLTIEKTSFTLADVFNRIISSMEIKATQKSLRLVHLPDSSVAKVLEGDPVRLGQILLNLVNNAIKFTDQGYVEISYQLVAENAQTNTIRFSVTDTGIGIEKSRIGKIFESYQQENQSTTRQYGGTGLGLSISRQLVELMGGKLLVESEKNKGSSFHFTLVLNQSIDNSYLERGKETVIDPEKLRGCKVLVVEDNEMNQYVAKSILRKWNMEVFQARNGQKAIDFLSHHECDIILMDKQMPIMNGVEATLFIRQTMKSDIPIIALTADAVIEMVQECLAAGMNDFVTKPFEPGVLYSKILEVLKIPIK